MPANLRLAEAGREAIRAAFTRLSAYTNARVAQDTERLLRGARDARSAVVLAGALTSVVAAAGLFAALSSVSEQTGPYQPEGRAGAWSLIAVVASTLLGGLVLAVSRQSVRPSVRRARRARRAEALLADNFEGRADAPLDLLRHRWRQRRREFGPFLPVYLWRVVGLVPTLALALVCALDDDLDRATRATLLAIAVGLAFSTLLAYVVVSQLHESEPISAETLTSDGAAG